MKELEAHLRECSVRQLILAMRLMRTDKDTIGFDYSKIRKDELIERACSMAASLSPAKAESVSTSMAKAFGWKAADISAKASAVGGSGTGTEGTKAKSKFSKWDDGIATKYGSGGPQHGPAQGGMGEDGEQRPGESSEKGLKRLEQMAKDAAKDAAKEAAPEAAQEAVDKAMEQVKEAMDKKGEGILEKLSKTVFKIEVTSDDDGDGEGEEGQQESGKEGKDGKKKKKTHQIDDGQPRHEIFKEVLEAVNKGLNVLLVGPAGCGKTHLAEDIAKVLSLGFRFTGAVSSEYKLLGFMSAQGALVRTEYREAYEHGGLFLWDELDASSAQALLSFNAGLANGHQDFPDKVIKQHPKFRAVASANTYGNGADRMYIGRNQLDAASLDRFYVVNMDYDEQLERALYGHHEWVLYVQAARKAMREIGGIRHVISMRAIQSGLKMLDTTVPRPKMEQACLWRHLQADDVAKIKRAMKEPKAEKYPGVPSKVTIA